ncbi:hypothetical protein [Vibrio cholerae]|uniref:hypothetical protein n=1 Tax=Vibrio cholerae TaxID=666 RepID=UPI0000F34DA9|nr:hypothetical protein [Vibrio cholerae]APF79512.1 hypothetical protein ASZ85_01986 [Vibrio cholerae]APF83470.1 hypothetical protein ASZ86_02050 [Vibrio cholerae]EAZ73580.1 hypothetical protein A5C_2071 [Vibrio cholerae NCTC 8457]
MSCTEIYSISDKHCYHLGETQNAWRGAMYVWNQIAQKYFGLEGFPHFDENMRKRVWNANNEHQLTDAEIIVLASTMDRVMVKVADVPRLIKAFEEYGKEHPNSSIGEQAEIIKASELSPEGFIAWCQTSVTSFHFEPTYIEENDECVYHDLSDGWDLFEQFEYVKTKSQGDAS